LRAKHDKFDKGNTPVMANDSEQMIYEMAWSSPRSWERLCKVLSYLDKDPLAKEIACKGMIEHHSALKIFNEIKDLKTNNKKIPSCSKILENPNLIDWEQENAMYMRQVFEAMQLYISKNTTQENVDKLAKFTEVISATQHTEIMNGSMIDILTVITKTNPSININAICDILNALSKIA